MQEQSRDNAAGSLNRIGMFVLMDAVLSLCLAGRHPRGNENSLALFVDAMRGRVQSDSMFYMDRAWTVLSQGKPLYETVFFGEHLKFIYPTSSLLIYWVAVALHWNKAVLVMCLLWTGVAGLLWLAGEILLGALDHSAMWNRWERVQARLLAALLAVFFYPLMAGVSLGQIQTVLTCLWMLAVWLWMRGGRVGSGVCLGVICTFKPTLAVFLLWGLLRRQWRFLLAFAGTMMAIQATAAGLFGWHNELEYLRLLSFLGHRGEAFLPNQSVNGLLERWTHNGDAVVWSSTVYPPYNTTVFFGTTLSSGLLLGSCLLVPMVRRWKDATADFLLFGMAATIASPIAWEHHYGYFLPGFLYLMGRMVKDRGLLPVNAGVCFLVLTNAWPWMARLAGTRWNPLVSYDLYAGLGLLVVMGVWADKGRSRFSC